MRKSRARYFVRKRFGWFGRVRVTCQDVGIPPDYRAPERWRASFRYIWDANDFVRTLCDGTTYIAVDSDYCRPDDAK